MTSRPHLLFGSTWSIEGDSAVRGKSGDTTRKLILSSKEKSVFWNLVKKETCHIPISLNRFKSWKMPSYRPGPETRASCRQTASFLGATVYLVGFWPFVFGLTMGEITWTIWRSCVCAHGEGGVLLSQRLLVYNRSKNRGAKVEIVFSTAWKGTGFG